jgi:hypothetical protein
MTSFIDRLRKAFDSHGSRGLEYNYALLMFAWAAALFMPGVAIKESSPLLALMPEWAWGVVGISFSTLRIVALIRNGGWRPSPLIRMFCAAFGALWWGQISALYVVGILAGGRQFPMLYGFAIFIGAEVYTVFRASREFEAARSRAAVPINVPA